MESRVCECFVFGCRRHQSGLEATPGWKRRTRHVPNLFDRDFGISCLNSELRRLKSPQFFSILQHILPASKLNVKSVSKRASESEFSARRDCDLRHTENDYPRYDKLHFCI